MRVIGYCTDCRKLTYVRVSNHDLAMAGARRVMNGTCTRCEDKQEKERRAKWLR